MAELRSEVKFLLENLSGDLRVDGRKLWDCPLNFSKLKEEESCVFHDVSVLEDLGARRLLEIECRNFQMT
jgi:hypothetical protein